MVTALKDAGVDYDDVIAALEKEGVDKFVASWNELMGVLAAKQMGAERIIAMSRHKTRQDLALEFGATDIISERGDEGVARIKELTNGVGAEFSAPRNRAVSSCTRFAPVA